MAGERSGVSAVIDIDSGKNTFHVVGLDGSGAIVLQNRSPPTRRTLLQRTAGP
jgi:hypothetical protein